MPVNATTNFCRDGFDFVHQSFEDHGAPLRAFAPHVVWHGTCTAARNSHSSVCSEHFHNRRFTIPRHLSERLLSRVSDRAHVAFVRSVRCLDDAVFFGERSRSLKRMRQWRHVIREMLDVGVVGLDAFVARRCFNSILLSRDFGLLLAPTKGSFCDKHWCEVYRRWLYDGGSLRRGHHRETDVCVDLVVARLPRELHVLVLRHVYYKFA
jgi:hypothetical protein